jgi:hypothetical protein
MRRITFAFLLLFTELHKLSNNVLETYVHSSGKEALHTSMFYLESKNKICRSVAMQCHVKICYCLGTKNNKCTNFSFLDGYAKKS